MFNLHNGGGQDWQNGFSVVSEGFAKSGENHLYAVGDTTRRTENNTHLVVGDDVGSVLSETAETNGNVATQTTPRQVIFKNSGGINLGTVDLESVESTVSVKVPYNFENTAEVTGGGVLYAGEESAEIKYTIRVGMKPNKVVGETYATRVKNVKYGLRVRYGEDDYEMVITSGAAEVLNENDNLSGAEISRSTNVLARDLPAGTKVWISAAVYPANSGDDTNLNADGNGEWYYSPEVEYVIAKRPSLQVWGGNIYSNGNIATSVARKKRIDGYADENRIFGSWGELGLMASGTVGGLASGAGMGYSDLGIMASLGGGMGDFCARSSLSFANESCGREWVGEIGYAVADGIEEREKKVILNKMRYDEDVERSETDEVGGLEVNDNKVRFYYAAGTLTVGGDIEYVGSYNDLLSVPKVVIYAEGNININCDVTRIDAVLIAEGEVKTCSNSDDNNARANSQQLVINGAVIANKLVANRTYGAATGINSIIPAEIINYDPTLYLWAGGQADVAESGRIITTYIHDIPPRL